MGSVGRLISNCVRYSCGSTSCLRQVLVKLARMAAVLPPRAFPTKSEFFRLRTTRFISLSLTLLSMGTTPSEQKTFSSFHWPRNTCVQSATSVPWCSSPSESHDQHARQLLSG